MSTAFTVHITLPKSGASPSDSDPLIGHSVLAHPETINFDHILEEERQAQFNTALAPYMSRDGNTYAVIETVWDDKEVTYAFTGLKFEGDRTDLPPVQQGLEGFVKTFTSGTSPYNSVLTQGTGRTRIEQRLLLFCPSEDLDAEGRPQVKSGQTNWARVYL